MLKQRVVTAAILLSLVIAALFFLPKIYYPLLMAMFTLAAAWEWGGLMRAASGVARAAYVVLVAFVLSALGWAVMNRPETLLVVLVLAVAMWVRVFARLSRAQHDRPLHERGILLRFLTGVTVLVPAWLALVHLYLGANYGAAFVLYLMLLVAVADTAAFFTGRRFGKHKLAAHISPGKTIEGAIGALAAGALFAIAGGWYFGFDVVQRCAFVLLCEITVVFSIVGDLFESLIKRQAGVKDSGTLLPGHGGVLDRIDSMTAAAPIFTLGLMALEAL